jgi:hypothetical protein
MEIYSQIGQDKLVLTYLKNEISLKDAAGIWG